MPVYWFENARGKIIEREFRVSDCPAEITERGQVFKKILAPISVCIPDHMKADHWDSKKSRLQHLNNEITAKRVAAGEAEYIDNPEQPREFKADFEQRLAKHRGKTRNA